MSEVAANGVVKFKSMYPMEATLERLQTILHEKGVTLFALVDHSGEAEKVGLKMPPTKLLVFGNPKAGTAVMLAAPSSALDLPLKILVVEDVDGSVWVSTNGADYLQKRHGIPADLLGRVAVAEKLAEAASK